MKLPRVVVPPGRARYALGVAFLVVVVQLTLWNLHVVRRNQEVLPRDETLYKRSGNIVTLAHQNPADVVRRYLATFYLLRELKGKTLVLPASMAQHCFFLEHVSGVHVELVSGDLELPGEPEKELRPLINRDYFLGASSPLHVVLDPTADRYVLARPKQGHDYFILPEVLYQQGRTAAQSDKGTNP
jgi:hypothetical protein